MLQPLTSAPSPNPRNSPLSRRVLQDPTEAAYYLWTALADSRAFCGDVPANGPCVMDSFEETFNQYRDMFHTRACDFSRSVRLHPHRLVSSGTAFSRESCRFMQRPPSQDVHRGACSTVGTIRVFHLCPR